MQSFSRDRRYPDISTPTSFHYIVTTDSCAVDCVVSNVEDWSDCSEPCGGGTQSYTPQPIIPASGGGMECPGEQTRTCNTDPCATCQLSSWGSWGSCSPLCYNGTSFSRSVSFLIHESQELDLVQERFSCNLRAALRLVTH